MNETRILVFQDMKDDKVGVWWLFDADDVLPTDPYYQLTPPFPAPSFAERQCLVHEYTQLSRDLAWLLKCEEKQ
jgi:hypothetical protein